MEQIVIEDVFIYVGEFFIVLFGVMIILTLFGIRRVQKAIKTIIK